MRRPVAISLSPNTENDDVLLALKTLVSPLLWFESGETEKLENEFAKKFGKGYKAIAVNSGRSALYLILKVLGVGTGTQVALQALTCVAVPNAVLWLGGSPLYIDVDTSFNLSASDLAGKVTQKTKAVIVQHAFGVPADMEQIIKIAKEKNIPVIEDCALSLGAEFRSKPVGTFGKVAFYSFGRDKVISSVFGGMILCKDKKLYKKLVDARDKLSYPGAFWIIQQLLHPILFSLILPLYFTGYKKVTIGKILLYIFQKIGLLSKPVYEEEKLGKRNRVFPAKMPGALSILARRQLKKLIRFNSHRNLIAKEYFAGFKGTKVLLPQNNNGSIWIRFPVITQHAESITKVLAKNKILLGNWYKDVVVPVRDLSLAGYIKGSCRVAESLAGKIVNLPTYPTLSLEEAKEVIRLIKLCKI